MEMWVTIGGVPAPQEDVVDNFCLNECSGKGDCIKGRYSKHYLMNHPDCLQDYSVGHVELSIFFILSYKFSNSFCKKNMIGENVHVLECFLYIF